MGLVLAELKGVDRGKKGFIFLLTVNANLTLGSEVDCPFDCESLKFFGFFLQGRGFVGSIRVVRIVRVSKVSRF